LTRNFGDRAWFVNVYKPVMGWDNHATRAFEMYDRLHKKNDMRFNLIVTAVRKERDLSKADGAYTQ
jgi:hypothetical protein